MSRLENEFIDQLNGTTKSILAGDMIMRDSDAVSCSIIYGQDDRSPIMRNTTHALYVAYAPPGVLEEQVDNHLLTIEKYIHHFATECIIEQKRLFYADGLGRDSNNEINDET